MPCSPLGRGFLTGAFADAAALPDARDFRLTDAGPATREPIAGQVAGPRYADMPFTSAGRE